MEASPQAPNNTDEKLVESKDVKVYKTVPYKKRIDEAIKALRGPENKPVSYISIAKYIGTKYPNTQKRVQHNCKPYLRKALARGVAKKTYSRVKNSFYLGPVPQPVPAVVPIQQNNQQNPVPNPIILKPVQQPIIMVQPIQNNNPVAAGTWQYYDDAVVMGKWWFDYDKPASDAVEKVYQDWLSNPGNFDVRSVSSGIHGYNYMVDFRNMTQTNIDHPNHTVRKIQRV